MSITHNDHNFAAGYQQQRLRLGILGVGSIVVATWIAALTNLPGIMSGWFGAWPAPLVGITIGALFAFCAGLIQLVPDQLARRLDQEYGLAPRPHSLSFHDGASLLRWLIGFALTGGVAGWVIGTFSDAWPALLMVVFAGFAIGRMIVPPGLTEATLSGQQMQWLERVSAELRQAGLHLPRLRWFDHGETTLAGGWQGVGPWRRLCLSTTICSVSPNTAAALIAREIGHAQHRHREFSAAVSAAWLALGVGIASLLAGAPSPGGGYVAESVAWLILAQTNTAFAGLFILPALGRRQVLSADRFAKQHVGEPEAQRMLDVLAQRNLPDESLGAVKGYVFHPIPPMALRRSALREATEERP